MKLLVALVVLALALASADAGASMHNPFYCYSTDPIRSMTNMHATATSYEAIRRFNFTTTNPYITTCTAAKFWYLGRYGGRFPLPGLMEQMLQFADSAVKEDIIRNYAAGRTSLCQDDFELIRDWEPEPNFNMLNASQITDSGVIAMQNIARRYQAFFPDLLPSTFSTNRYHFRHTDFTRTNQSIRAFATGLFGEEGAQSVVYEPVPETDWLLRAIDFCPLFWNETADWPAQQNAFAEGPEFQEMIEEVNRRLGFQGRFSLNVDQIVTMWEWCRFETGSEFETSGSETGPDSVWCAPFSIAHQLLLEYYADLGHFYFTGYGVRNQRMLENLKCGLMQDLLTFVQGDSEQTARIFITYTQEIQTMLVAFSTFRDLWPMHQHNYAQQMYRNWLTSLITPLGANIVVLRFDCEDDDDDLVFLLNERPILLPGCDQQTGVCKLSVFVNRFRRFMDANCEELFCSSD